MDKMVSPVQVSPLIKLVSYSALFLSVAYGARRYNYPKPWAEEERRIFSWWGRVTRRPVSGNGGPGR